ncbi:hypothetical protein [Phormidesmis priestleyi]
MLDEFSRSDGRCVLGYQVTHLTDDARFLEHIQASNPGLILLTVSG